MSKKQGEEWQNKSQTEKGESLGDDYVVAMARAIRTMHGRTRRR